jgi:hypothetical protein
LRLQICSAKRWHESKGSAACAGSGGPDFGSHTDKADPAGFSFAFAGRGKLLAAPFKLMLLRAADATGRTNLAAHRCSNFL